MTDDFMEPEWYDIDCFFKVRRPVSVDFIDGFTNLRLSHQKQILYYLGKLDFFKVLTILKSLFVIIYALILILDIFYLDK